MIIDDELISTLKVIKCGEIIMEYCMHIGRDLKTRNKSYNEKLLMLYAISPMMITKLVENAPSGRSFIEAKETPPISVPR